MGACHLCTLPPLFHVKPAQYGPFRPRSPRRPSAARGAYLRKTHPCIPMQRPIVAAPHGEPRLLLQVFLEYFILRYVYPIYSLTSILLPLNYFNNCLLTP